MLFLAKVRVLLKPTVNDPQGLSVRGGLHSLGFRAVQDVRVGKYLELHVEAADRREARQAVEEMCQKLLANPVIEQFRFDLERAPSRRDRPAPASSR